MADGQTQNSDPSESIAQYIWNFGSGGQTYSPGIVTFTATLSSSISVKTITNFGIESNAQTLVSHSDGIGVGSVVGRTRTHTGTSANAFAGSIDDVAIFNRFCNG